MTLPADFPHKEFAHLCNLTGETGFHHFFGRPHRMEHDGVVWSFVTDGYHLLAYRAVDIFCGTPADQIPFHPGVDKESGAIKRILAMIDAVPAGDPADLAALRAWAGSPEWPMRDGWGGAVDQLWPNEIRQGRLGAAIVDLHRLARLLDGLPGDRVIVNAVGRLDLVRIDGPGWIAAIMPCDPTDAEMLQRVTVFVGAEPVAAVPA